MFIKHCIKLAIVLSLLFVSQFSFAEYAKYNGYSLFQVGNIGLDDTTVDFNIGDGEEYQATLSDLPLISGGAHIIQGGSFIEYGFEAGGLLSWQNDSVAIAGCSGCGSGGTTVVFSAKNKFYHFGTYIGGLVNIPLTQHARLFATAGPSFSVSSIAIDGDNLPTVTPVMPPTPEYSNQREYSFDVGWYATAGIMVSPTKSWEFGVMYRVQDFGIDFSDSYVDTDYKGEHLMIAFGLKL